ncbi:MAG: restriction endonuclease subunit S [Methanoregula sp.]
MKKTVVISPESSCFPDDELPEGWKFVTINSACEVNPPKPSKDFLPADAPVTFVPMSAVDADMGAITNPQIKPYLEVRNGFTSFCDGDVIMAKITPCMENGKAAIVHGMKNGIGFGSTEFHVMRSRGEILPEYLFYYIRQESFRNEAESHFTGSVGQKRVPADFIKQRVIPRPPLAEQELIVARIEALLTQVNAARDRLNRVPLIMKRFRQAVLAAACSGRLMEGCRESNAVEGIEQSLQKDNVDFNDETNTPFYIGSLPKTWGWISIDDAMEKVIDYRGRTPPIEKEGIPHITTSNIRNGHINWITEKFVTQETYENYMTRGIPEIGDVFFTMEGPLGEVAILHENRKFSLAQRMLLLRGQKEIFDSEYLAFALMCSGVQSAINMKATGSGVKGIAYKRFKQVQIPHPPLSEQHKIVRRVRLLFERADAIDREVVVAGRRCERLTQAVLAKAFRGELVR